MTVVLTFFPGFPKGVLIRNTVLYVVYPATATTMIIINGLNSGTTSLISCAVLIGLATTLIVPVFAPVVRPRPSCAFDASFALVLKRIFPLLFFPFILTVTMHDCVPQLRGLVLRYGSLTFCL